MVAEFPDVTTLPAVMVNESGSRLVVTSLIINAAAAGSDVRSAASSGLSCCQDEMNDAIC